ncbi:hypothetical protein BVRB_1g004970 [Beta vulgaris subsp. vulgaris]|nr:hypothetical protein BVRB_1g004970 [Beta vulgaris subsp. vulgaris]
MKRQVEIVPKISPWLHFRSLCPLSTSIRVRCLLQSVKLKHTRGKERKH